MTGPTVAALYVSRKGPYWGRPDVDAWDEERDARKYDGPLPVVAHPPCARWCRLAKLVQSRYPRLRVGEDGGCFASALANVRRCGGLLEHPAWTQAWTTYALPIPMGAGWSREILGSWVCEVRQSAYGHPATKATWLYYVGANPPEPMDWRRIRGNKVVGHCTRRGDGTIWRRNADRMSSGTELTPPSFAEALLSLARNCGGSGRRAA